MDLTIEHIQQRFQHFNQLIFGSSLQSLPIRLSNARTFLGQLRYHRKRSFWGKTRYSDFLLVISRHAATTPQLLDDTIIHEMIHYHILSNNLKDTSSHGRIFRQMMNDINTRFQRNITISHRTSPETHSSSDTTIHQHYFCISRFADGRLGITVAAKTRIRHIAIAINRVPEIQSHQWYTSTHPILNRYRRSLTLKVYLITPTDLTAILSTAPSPLTP